MRPLRAATRGSRLALVQTELVGSLLAGPAGAADAAGGTAAEAGAVVVGTVVVGTVVVGRVAVETVVVQTRGDREADAPLWQIGGQGAFVKEVQAAVLDGRADFAVHSAKDLPSSPTPGLVIGAVPERGDARDALVGRALDDLVAGALVGTGSVRRRAQLAWLRPDLTFAALRGNIDTRLEKAARFDAVVVAAAALARLDRRSVAAQYLDPDLVVPQAGQGCLAVECRSDDADLMEALAAIDDAPSHAALDAERAFLAAMGTGCDLPVGVYATIAGHRVRLRAVLATLDGRVLLRHQVEGDEPAEVGRQAARYLLDEAGGRSLLDSLLPATA